MTASYQNKIFSIITLVILLPLFLGVNISSSFDIALLLLSLILTGIPHGAIDHVIYQHKANNQSNNRGIWLRFFLPYLGLITFTMLVWLWVPTFMFWVFMLVSAYHFGQSQLYHVDLSETSLFKIMLYTLWGVFFLSVLWLFNWDAFAAIIQTVFDWKLAFKGTSYFYLQTTALISLVATVSGLTFMVIKSKMSFNLFFQELFILGLLTALIKFSSLYMAFAIYFGLWHATRVMITEYRFLSSNVANRPSLWSFIKAFIPFSLLSIVGIGLLLLAAQYFKATIAPFMLFMVFISALTMPHAYIMHGMYRSLQKKTNVSTLPKLSEI